MSGAVIVRAVIVDDEPLARGHLRAMLDGVAWIECVGDAADGESAVRAIDALAPELVFLDIQLPGASGIEVLQRVRHQPAVIFTTAFDQYAVAAFELQALDYLVKPFGRERFMSSLERARRALDSDDGAPPVRDRARDALGDDGPLTRLFVHDRGRIVPVAAAEIERLEAEDDYVAIHARGRRFLVYLTLNEFERRLDPERFLRIHRSHVVNLDFVSHLVPYDGSRLQVEMRDGTKLMASKTRSRALRHLAI